LSLLHKLLGLPLDKPEYRKLWWQIVITIMAFSVVPLVALGAVIYYQFSASYNAKINETLRTLAENRRDSLDLFLDERVSQITSLAHTHTLAQIKDEQYLQELFYIIQSRSKSYMDLGVIDQEGRHLAYVGPFHYREILKDVNYKNEEWFHAVMSQGFYISDVFLGFRKVPHFIIAVRARQGNWILRATIDSDIIEGLVRAAQVGKWGDAFLINRENILQTAPRYCGRLLEKPTCPELEALPDFHQVSGLSLEEMVSGGRTSLFAAIPLQKKRWVLVIKEDPSEKLTPLFRTRHLHPVGGSGRGAADPHRGGVRHPRHDEGIGGNGAEKGGK
jgi:two-component system NtrC family sensor kinase